MRVLMSSGFYDIGGSSTVMEKLANKLAKNGHAVTIGALWFRNFPSKDSCFRVASIPVGNALELVRFLRKFDVIHSHHPLTNYLALLSNTPFIYHYHGAPDSGKGALNRVSMFSSIKIAGYHFDAVIAVSEAAASELKQHFRSDKIHVVHNGVDTNCFTPGREPKFRKGVPQLLFVGNLYEHKNVDELLFALKALLREFPRAFLQIVGNGLMYEHLKNLVTELDLENNVELIGRVSNFELPYYYASCDVYVTASRWELFGLPLLEAMACGKPIVASSIPPHIELLTKSKAGMIYVKGDVDALCRNMIKTYEDHDRYGHNALQFANQYDWSSVANKVEALYYDAQRVF